MSKNLSELSGRKGLGNNLFEKLGDAALLDGTPAIDKLEKLKEEFLFGNANLYGSVSFYDFLKPENKGKKVYVCNGSACLTAGTQPSLTQKLSEVFNENEIGEMCCLGRCHENSAFNYGGKNYSGNAIDQLDAIKKAEQKPVDEYYVGSSGTPILTAKFPGIEKYYSLLEKTLSTPVAELLAEIKLSGLRGRGGAGFPIAFKLESCMNTAGDQKFIVCNADEGDPGAYSDRYIMEQRPHSLLLGMIIAGYIAGADTGVVYIRGEYPESVDIISNEVEVLRANKFIGENIFNSGFSFHFKIIKAQGAYICGEETALLSSLEGQRPEVRIRPPFPTQEGLFNKPTVVN
ncbi:MAG: hypothetical protein LH473_03460, partial [Chitinophagales bacterium]|nr:hypothetical protein [Chitinophagales bacterium]